MTIFHLASKGLLGVAGDKANAFLQSCITQDMRLLDMQGALYGALLTPQGRFLYDFIVVKWREMFVLVCAKDELMPLAQELHKYSVGQGVEFHDLSEDAAVLSSDAPVSEDVFAVEDPRHAGLGFICLSEAVPEGCEGEPEYHRKRVSLGVPDGAFDGIKRKTLLNELRLEDFNGVSFNKGCYVGQELTARTKFRTEPKKKLFKVEADRVLSLEAGAPLLLEDGSEIGWVFSQYGCEALAILRVKNLSQTFRANGYVFSIA